MFLRVVVVVVVVVVVALVVDTFLVLGLNFSNRDFSFSTALCEKGLLSLFLFPLVFFNKGLNRGFSVSIRVSSFSSLVIFCPFRILNRSAKERGLNVVVVVVRFVGSVLILNKLNRVVDSVVVAGVDFSLLLIIAQGSKADCNLSNWS